MTIRLLAVGKCKGAEQELAERYLKRFTTMKVTLHEVDDRGTKEAQGQRISKLVKDAPMWLWDSKGDTYTSAQLATHLQAMLEKHKDIVMVIGGSHGFSAEMDTKAAGKLSLGAMTFPHQLARVMVLEQLYRSQCIQTGHPYHH